MQQERGRWAKKWGATLVTALLLAGVVGGLAFAREKGALNHYLCEGMCPDEYAALPEPLPEPTVSALPDAPPNPEPVDGKALATALAEPLADPLLGGEVSFLALDLRSGKTLVEHDVKARVPASTTKVLITWAALELLGPEHRFTTEVRHKGSELVLVGGGDPYLTKKALRTLAKKAAASIGSGPVTLRADTSLFEGEATSPTWPDSYVPVVMSPVSALGLDSGETPAAAPATTTLSVFAGELERAGVKVQQITDDRGPAKGKVVANVEGERLERIARKVLLVSDNVAAEILLRHIALAGGQKATFDGGAKALAALLVESRVPVDGLELHDGSGLSRSNRVSPVTLAKVLVNASTSDRSAALVDGMPVAGLNGTLEERFARSSDARGLVRAKTGTLTGVSALAGWTVAKGGSPIAFVLMTDGIDGRPNGAPEAAVDRIVAVLSESA